MQLVFNVVNKRLAINFGNLNFYKRTRFNSFSAKGNIQVFANNTDSGESIRNDFEHGRVFFKQFGAERVKQICQGYDFKRNWGKDKLV